MDCIHQSKDVRSRYVSEIDDHTTHR